MPRKSARKVITLKAGQLGLLGRLGTLANKVQLVESQSARASTLIKSVDSLFETRTSDAAHGLLIPIHVDNCLCKCVNCMALKEEGGGEKILSSMLGSHGVLSKKNDAIQELRAHGIALNVADKSMNAKQVKVLLKELIKLNAYHVTGIVDDDEEASSEGDSPNLPLLTSPTGQNTVKKRRYLMPAAVSQSLTITPTMSLQTRSQRMIRKALNCSSKFPDEFKNFLDLSDNQARAYAFAFKGMLGGTQNFPQYQTYVGGRECHLILNQREWNKATQVFLWRANIVLDRYIDKAHEVVAKVNCDDPLVQLEGDGAWCNTGNSSKHGMVTIMDSKYHLVLGVCFLTKQEEIAKVSWCH